jgi:uncharacterized protein with FMN-binding domain
VSGSLGSRVRRRQAGFLGLFLACVALVEGKAMTAPPTHRISLGSAGTSVLGKPPAAVPPTPTRRPVSGRSPAPAQPTSRTVTGQPIDIGYGIVQVKLTLRDGHIVDVSTLQAPSGGRSGSIASYAIPQLRQEVLSAQSTQIDTVSGASYTSEGYARSVQSALDAGGA